ncbi:DUF1433 domain-containing protein [Bacillus vallismortis]|uniref:DUF1433 domain-containing protein n=1 Tax=Bacillus vallismortis TaxID=72361 RepID=UPI002091403B|nr:DUF1433 domain-containing protein [Bacillus vallismortis]MCO4851255.1 DUF1433 domain-containing protein [Bacillus vallismortis]
MKKPIIILTTLALITLGGIYTKHQYDEKQEKVKTAELELFDKAKKRMTDYINANYKDIGKIDFSNKYEIDPMGGINAEGYLNGNKEKEFWGIYDNSNDTITSSYVDAKEKPECKDKPCEY